MPNADSRVTHRFRNTAPSRGALPPPLLPRCRWRGQERVQSRRPATVDRPPPHLRPASRRQSPTTVAVRRSWDRSTAEATWRWTARRPASDSDAIRANDDDAADRSSSVDTAADCTSCSARSSTSSRGPSPSCSMSDSTRQHQPTTPSKSRSDALTRHNTERPVCADRKLIMHWIRHFQLRIICCNDWAALSI